MNGIFDLLFASAENLEQVDANSLRFVIIDAQRKLGEIKECIEKLTAA